MPLRSQIVSSIINGFAGKKYDFSHLPKETHTPLKDLSIIHRGWSLEDDGDFLGYIYQGLETCGKKKDSGQFFTMPSIIEYIAEASALHYANFTNIKILDPACGSGQFLLIMFKSLLKTYLDHGWTKEKAAEAIITNNLYGSDIDEIACFITRQNLLEISGAESRNIFTSDFISSEVISSEDPLKEMKFDIIVGNPPWGSNITKADKSFYKTYYQSIESGMNSFTLFIEKSLSQIKDGGCLSFLIPDAYLNIKAHMSSRKYVLENCCIREIRLWGDPFKKVYAPCATITMIKEPAEDVRSANVIRITDSKVSTNTATLIPQESYRSTYQNIFNIHFSKRAESLISKIGEEGSFSLKNNAQFFLGIVTGSNDKFIALNQSDQHPDPIVIGKDVEKYKIAFSGHYFKYDPDNLQQVAPKNYYQTQGKILYKFIGKRLTFAVDKTGMFSLNNVNGFIPRNNDCTSEYLAALLNSPVMQYFYEKNFFTLKVLRNNLEKLPLKMLPPAEMKKITMLYNTISESNSSAEKSSSEENINDMFFHAYGISDKLAVRMIHGAANEDEGQGFIFH
jgi:predicted RNA methylase